LQAIFSHILPDGKVFRYFSSREGFGMRGLLEI
jgi:hypothetical protein